MRLEHVGIAVSNLERALRSFEALLGVPRYKSEEVVSENVVTHFISAEGVKIELLESTDPKSAVARFIDKRGEGIHHLAFSVDDLDATQKRLLSMGFRIVGQGAKQGADDKRIFFLHPKDLSGVLVECCSSATSESRQREGVALPSGVITRNYGSPLNTRVLVLRKQVDSSDPITGNSIAARLEPVSHISLVDYEKNASSIEQMVSELVQWLDGVPFHVVTLGGSSCEIASRLAAASVPMKSWTRVEWQGDEGVNERTGRPVFPHLLVRMGFSGNESAWPIATLPLTAVHPDRPESDALIPLFRSLWNSIGD